MVLHHLPFVIKTDSSTDCFPVLFSSTAIYKAANTFSPRDSSNKPATRKILGMTKLRAKEIEGIDTAKIAIPIPAKMRYPPV